VDKKWYEYFVSVDQPAEAGPEEASSPRSRATPKPTRTPAQTVAEIASTVASEPRFTTPIKNPNSFEEIYRAAEIQAPGQEYTILKVADMLQSEHIRNMTPEVKRNSILVALDAAGVKVQEIIQDAVRRDRALDTYERVQQKALEQLEARKNKESAEIQAEIDRFVAQQRARIEANSDEVAREKERLYAWRLKKQQEEQRIADAVSYFVTENPITTGTNEAAPTTTRAPKN